MPIASPTPAAPSRTLPDSAPAANVAPAPGALAFVALAGIALLGNGLKAVISSSVLVSEAQFAVFLGIATEHVAELLESIIAGMVVALAACPLLLQRTTARSLAITACVVATVAFATFALVDLARPGPATRELAAFACFAVGAGALALLAPTSQALVALLPSRTSLTALWTGAAPAGFLVAPQMIKYLLPVLGLGYYFLAFSTLPLVLLALLAVLGFALPAVRAAGTNASALPAPMLLAFVATVIGFEVWTTFGSVAGYAKPATWAALTAFAAMGGWLARELRRYPFPPSLTGPSGGLLLALFVIEIPTTGFFDTAFLAQRQFSQAFIADRSTLAAAAQILGTLAAGMLVHRRPGAQSSLLLGFATIAVAGLAAIALYPWIAHPLYYLWTPAVEGFGAAGLTLLVCLAVVRAAALHPLLAVLPSIAIMLGTEFGLELLQLVYAVARTAGMGADDAYGAIFVAQVGFALAALALIGAAIRREVK